MAWTLRKRGRIWWASKTVDGARERKSTKCSDKRAAELVVARWERLDADPRHRAAHETTLETCLGWLIADRKNVRDRAAGTIKMYTQKAAHVLRILGRETPLAEIGAPEIDSFIEKRLEEGAHRSTIGKELTTIRGALRIAKRRGAYPADIAEVMPVQWSNDYTPRETFLTPEQVGRLFDELAVDRSTRARIDGVQQRTRLDRVGHIALILATGVRWSESLKVERRDVDLVTWDVRVRGTKTVESNATISISPTGRPLLRTALDLAPGGKVGPLFRSWKNYRRDLAQACDRAGVPRVTPNDLRRTCATWLVTRGASLFATSKVLRHRDTRMVERVYAKLGGSNLRETLEREVGGDEITVPVACPAPVVAAPTQAPIDPRSEEGGACFSCPGTESNCRHADFQSDDGHVAPSSKDGDPPPRRPGVVPVACPAGSAVEPLPGTFGELVDGALALDGGRS